MAFLVYFEVGRDVTYSFGSLSLVKSREGIDKNRGIFFISAALEVF
jgi:hypothetical protein